MVLGQSHRREAEVDIFAETLDVHRQGLVASREVSVKGEYRRLERIPGNWNEIVGVPPRLKHMMIGQDVPGGIYQETSAENVGAHGTAISFGSNHGVATAIDQRVAISVKPGEPELRAALLFVKANHRVDEAHAVGIIPHNLLRDAGLAFKLSDPRIGFFQAAVETDTRDAGRGENQFLH